MKTAQIDTYIGGFSEISAFLKVALKKVQQLGDGSLIRDIKQLLKKLIRSDEFEAICKMPEEAGELLRTPKGKTFTLSLPKIGSQVLS